MTSSDLTFDGRASNCFAFFSLTCSHISSSFDSGSGTSGGASGTIVDTEAKDFRASDGFNLGVLSGVAFGANALSMSASNVLEMGGRGLSVLDSGGMFDGRLLEVF